MRDKVLLMVAVLATLIAGLVTAMAGSEESPAGEEVQVSYYYYGNPGEKAAEEAAVAAFDEAFSSIAVEAVHVPDAYEDKIRILVAGGTPPDVAVWNPEHLSKLYRSLLPLNEWIDTDLNTAVYSYPQAFLDAGTMDGVSYLLPKRFDGIGVMVYNKTLFDEMGLPSPGEPYPTKLTVEEFADLARQIAQDLDGDGVNDIYATDPLYYGITFPWFGIQNEGLGRDYRTPEWDSSAMLEMLEFIYEAEVEEQWALPWGENRLEWFTSGKLAMMTDFGLYLMPELETITTFEWDIAARPGMEAPLNRPGMIAIFADGGHPEESWELAKFLSTDIRAQTALSTAFGLGVTTESAEAYLAGAEKRLQYLADAVDTPPARYGGVPSARFGDMMGMLWREKDPFYAGSTTPAEFAANVQELFLQVLAEEEEAGL